MRNYDLLLSSQHYSLYEMQEITKDEIKNISKAVLKAYNKGIISEQLFEQLFEYLLAYFFESTVNDKLFNKTYELDEKLFLSKFRK